jgi:hypothetical protein
MKSKRRIIITVIIYVLAILSAAAGVPKIMQMPQELDFLRSIGLPQTGVLVLGLLQLSGGILLLWKKSRLPGAVIASFTFLVSSIAIFVGGNTSFGLFSLLPVVASLIVVSSLLRQVEHNDA